MQSGGADWDDPGWPPRVLLALLPLWANFVIGRRRKASALLTLRTLYVALVAAPFYLLFVLTFLDEEHPADPVLSPSVAGLVTAGTGALFLVGSLRMRGRGVPLGMSEVVGGFRAVFFLRFALANSATLVGFVLFFPGGSYLWIYLVGLGFGMTGLLAMAPTKASIDAWDRRHQGGELRPSLGQLLAMED